MRRLLLPFLICFLIFWLFGGAWWYAKELEPKPINIKSELPIAPSFNFIDGSFDILSKENVSFTRSSHEPNIPEQLNRQLLRLSEYLNKKESRNLLLTGRYTIKETNRSLFANLGIARAEALKSRLIRLGLDGDRIETRSTKVDHIYFQGGSALGLVSFKSIDRDRFSQ